MSTFVFLELNDENIVGLINGIREEVTNKPISSSVHLTVRGPYKENMVIENSEIAKWDNYLRKDDLLLNGIGKFKVGSVWYVYIKVEHKNLQRIWWKPDFPVGKYGFNPHITLLETSDPEYAKVIEQFLKKEQLSFICHNFRLTTYTLKQKDFFDSPNTDYIPPLKLFNSGKLSLTFFSRLKNVVKNYQRQS